MVTRAGGTGPKLRRGLTVLAAGFLFFGAVPVSAGWGPSDSEQDKARALHQKGAERLRLRDYEGALEAFAEAVEATQSRPEQGGLHARARWGRVKALRALGRVCEAREDLDALREMSTAGMLPEKMSGEMAALESAWVDLEACAVGTPPEAPVAEPRGEHGETDAASGSTAGPEVPPEGELPDKGRVSGGDEPGAVGRGDDRGVPSDRRAGRGLRIAGGVVAGFGVSALGVMGGMLYWSAELQREFEDPEEVEDLGARREELRGLGFLANDLATTSAVIGGVMTLAGVALVAVGVRRGWSRRVAATPTILGRSAALTVRYVF